MRFMWLAVVAVSLLAFGIAFVIAFAIGLDRTTAIECDGVCTDRIPETAVWASVVGCIAAVLAGGLTLRLLRRLP